MRRINVVLLVKSGQTSYNNYNRFEKCMIKDRISCMLAQKKKGDEGCGE